MFKDKYCTYCYDFRKLITQHENIHILNTAIHKNTESILRSYPKLITEINKEKSQPNKIFLSLAEENQRDILRIKILLIVTITIQILVFILLAYGTYKEH